MCFWIIVSRITLVTWTPPPLVLSLRPPCSKHVLTFCSSESWSGSFIAGTAPPFSIKWCANPASNWALFIKCSSTDKLAKNCPGKTNWIQCSRNAGFFWKLNKVIFTLQPKTQRHSLETLFLSESRAALPNEALRWACSGSRSSGRNAYCTEPCHSDRNLRTAWFQKGDFKTGIQKLHWEDFYHYMMNVYTHCQYTFMFKQIVKWILHPMTPLKIALKLSVTLEWWSLWTIHLTLRCFGPPINIS